VFAAPGCSDGTVHTASAGNFSDTPVTHLGGAVAADTSRILQVISEGGGTPALRPYLRFVNLMIGK